MSINQCTLPVPAEIQRLDRSSLLLTKSVLYSAVLHLALLACVQLVSWSPFHAPVEIVAIQVSRLIVEPRVLAAQQQPEPLGNALVRPQREEPLPNIVPKAKTNRQHNPVELPIARTQVIRPQAKQSIGVPDESAAGASALAALEAQPLNQINPEIPNELKSREYRSYVRVRVEIGADGTSVSTLKTSSGNRAVDERVIAALNRWRWRPALLAGRPVSSVRYFRFEFEVK